jgi:hypothetical protein
VKIASSNLAAPIFVPPYRLPMALSREPAVEAQLPLIEAE